MKSHHWRTLAVVFVICSSAAWVWTVERAWQKGTWRDVQVKRPKVVFGVAPNSPNTGVPRTSPPAAQEIRTYVIETDTTRFELRENATVDTPRMDILVGEPVEFAVEKKTVWVKDPGGREHKLSLVKESKKEEGTSKK
jgi:hypothetical protein